MNYLSYLQVWSKWIFSIFGHFNNKNWPNSIKIAKVGSRFSSSGEFCQFSWSWPPLSKSTICQSAWNTEIKIWHLQMKPLVGVKMSFYDIGHTGDDATFELFNPMVRSKTMKIQDRFRPFNFRPIETDETTAPVVNSNANEANSYFPLFRGGNSEVNTQVFPLKNLIFSPKFEVSRQHLKFPAKMYTFPPKFQFSRQNLIFSSKFEVFCQNWDEIEKFKRKYYCR